MRVRRLVARRTAFVGMLLVLLLTGGTVASSAGTAAFPVTPRPPGYGLWTNVSSNFSLAPPSSWDWASSYDSATRSVFVFGGCPFSLGTPCLNETWSFDSATGWRELNNGSNPGPSARQGPVVAYDPATGAVILFGGDRLGTELRDTWEWKSGVWRNISTAVGSPPAGRFDAEMVWDPVLNAMVLYGGSNCILTGCTATWEFNGTWHLVRTSTTPPGRAYFGLVYDESTRTVILSSGQAYANGSFYGLNDTWSFDGAAWTLLHPASAPPLEQQAVMVYDTTLDEIVYFPTGTGATWVYRSSDWVNLTSHLPVSPSARALPGMAMDRADRSVVMFGGAWGIKVDGQAGGSSPKLNDTWLRP